MKTKKLKKFQKTGRQKKLNRIKSREKPDNKGEK